MGLKGQEKRVQCQGQYNVESKTIACLSFYHKLTVCKCRLLRFRVTFTDNYYVDYNVGWKTM